MIYAGTSDGKQGSEITPTLRGWLIWGTAALFYLYEFFVRVAPASMEPELQATFHLSAAGLGAAMGMYYTIYSPMQLVAGSLLDRFGAKNILVPAAAICTAGAFLQFFGTSVFTLTASRFLQGFGSAFAFVGTMYLAAQWFPRSKLALFSGLTTSLGMAGAIAGNAGISHVVETFGWRTALLVAGGVGVVVTLLILSVVPKESRVRHARAESTVLERGPGLLQSLKIVYSNPQSWFAGLAGTALYMPLSVLGALWGVEYLVAVTHGTKDQAAGAASMMYVGWLVAGPLIGWYSDRSGLRRKPLLIAGICTLLTTLVIVMVPSLSVSASYVLMFVLGLASCSQVVCFVVTVERNPANVAGTSIAATNMMIMLLGGIGEWAFGMILDWVSGNTGITSGYPESAYRKAILLLPLISGVGLIAAFMLKEDGRDREEMPTGPEPMR